MIISLIAAMSEDRVIGHAGRLPWDIPIDLARFKSITMGHTVLMGRKTYQSIGHPLPGRTTIVLTRSIAQIAGCLVARSLTEAISAAGRDDEIFVCGGESVYKEALPFSQRIYLTVVHGHYPGEVRFPNLPLSFLELQREKVPNSTPPLTFLVYEKVERIEADADARALRLKGEEAQQRELYFLARRCLELAQALDENPETASDLAFCRAKSGGNLQDALHEAQRALLSLPENPRCHLNLGRLQLMAGEKDAGVITLRNGVQLGGGAQFQAELEKVGIRVPPLIETLPRSHPLNKYLGLLLHRIGLRR